MIYLRNFDDNKNKKPFLIIISVIVFFSGIYAGMYTSRFGHLSTLKRHIKSIKHSPKKYFDYTFSEQEEIENVNLKIKFKDYIKLSNERFRHLYSYNHFIKGSQWTNKSNFYAKSKIKLDNEQYKIKVKLFGLNNDHFRHPYKWSFRVKAKEFIKSFHNEKFNILQANTRMYLSDIACSAIFKANNFIALEYKPINLKINSNPRDLYLIEDFFTKNLMEKNKHRESYIFTDNDINHPNNSKITKQQSNHVLNLREKIKKNTGTIINKNSFNLFLSLCFIAKNKHPALPDNLHYFYNNVSNDLNPIIREVFFEQEITATTDILLKKELTEFLISIKSYNPSLEKHIESILKNQSQYNSLYNTVFKTSSQLNELYKSDEWKKLENIIYTRYPEALDQCKLMYINPNKILNITHSENNFKTIIKNHYIKKDTVLTSDINLSYTNLHIKKGVNLNLNGHNIILSKGALLAKATEKNPIIITNLNSNNRSSIIVKNAIDTCYIENVTFNKLANYNYDYWKLPSAVTFYESKVKINNSLFKNNQSGDDYLNVFRCDFFTISNTKFSNILSDGIDSDFSNGNITSCSFTKIGNDAIDGSGSEIKINNCIFNKIADKAISAGELSKFEIKNSIISNSEISFVSKDGSNIKENNNTLLNNRLNYCVFNKKEEYINGTLSSDKDISTYSNLIEHNSYIYLNKEINTNIKYIENVKNKLYGKEYGKKTIK